MPLKFTPGKIEIVEEGKKWFDARKAFETSSNVFVAPDGRVGMTNWDRRKQQSIFRFDGVWSKPHPHVILPSTVRFHKGIPYAFDSHRQLLRIKGRKIEVIRRIAPPTLDLMLNARIGFMSDSSEPFVVWDEFALPRPD